MFRIGIVGTAGRKSDYEKLSKDVYLKMYDATRCFLKEFCPTKRSLRLISGGAAWADHLAVALFLANHAEKLTLYLPAEFENGSFREAEDFRSPGNISNYYHRRFTSKLGMSSFEQIQAAIDKGAEVIVMDGFFIRNGGIADNVDVLLAFTFGAGETPKADSGTFHTWNICPAEVKIHVPIQNIDEYI